MSLSGAPTTLRARALERAVQLPVEAFRRGYVSPRRPVVLPRLACAWPASGTWSLDYLQTRYAAAEVTAIRADGGRVIMDADKGSVTERMPLGTFIDALRGGRSDLYLTSRMKALPQEARRDAPPPPYCAEATWQNSNLWIGPAGTVARMHRDLADNIHAVVRGRKRFTLVAPHHSSRLYPHRIFDAFPNGCRVDIENPDFTRFPRLEGVEILVAELQTGDAIYIPRRWWHHVRTLDLTVSVNYWWADGARSAIVLAADYFKRIRGISR
jgi:[protein]-arginine 3-hydroxylase / protease